MQTKGAKKQAYEVLKNNSLNTWVNILLFVVHTPQFEKGAILILQERA